jgi:hypothetical protein
MSKFHNTPLLDEATLKQMDEEAQQGLNSASESLQLPTINPESDPFGMNYSWLDEPAPKAIEDAYLAFVKQPAIAWHRKVGAEFRQIALAGSLAAGSNPELFKKWSHETFGALCEAQGQGGEQLLENLRNSPERTSELVAQVVNVLKTDVRFASLDIERQVAAALIVIDAFAEQPK